MRSWEAGERQLHVFFPVFFGEWKEQWGKRQAVMMLMIWVQGGTTGEDADLVGAETCWSEKNKISWWIAAEIINRNYEQIIFPLPWVNMDAQKQEQGNRWRAINRQREELRAYTDGKTEACRKQRSGASDGEGWCEAAGAVELDSAASAVLQEEWNAGHNKQPVSYRYEYLTQRGGSPPK